MSKLILHLPHLTSPQSCSCSCIQPSQWRAPTGEACHCSVVLITMPQHRSLLSIPWQYQVCSYVQVLALVVLSAWYVPPPPGAGSFSSFQISAQMFPPERSLPDYATSIGFLPIPSPCSVFFTGLTNI
jgi:hypothetical protein